MRIPLHMDVQVSRRPWMGESDLPLRQPFNSDPKGSLLNGSMVEWMRTCENPTHMARIVLTCMAGIVPNNLSAFPPSLEVRCTNAAGAWMRRSGLQSFCISSVLGGQMWEVSRSTGDRQGCRKLEQCRSNCRDGRERPPSPPITSRCYGV